MLLCFRAKGTRQFKRKVNQKNYNLFIEKHNGNKSLFAKKAGCDEKTIRLIFDHNQGLTINLFLKIAYALDEEPSELLKDIKLENKET